MNANNSNERYQEYGTMRSTNGTFATGNNGRPKGSKNKTPNIETMNELLKSSILYQKTNGAYTLKESSIYFIELWLKEQKIIS